MDTSKTRKKARHQCGNTSIALSSRMNFLPAMSFIWPQKANSRLGRVWRGKTNPPFPGPTAQSDPRFFSLSHLLSLNLNLEPTVERTGESTDPSKRKTPEDRSGKLGIKSVRSRPSGFHEMVLGLSGRHHLPMSCLCCCCSPMTASSSQTDRTS